MEITPMVKPEIIKAIVDTRAGIGRLGKSAMNPHGRYKYVSIDAYYEKVALIAAENGLSWVISEVDFKALPDFGVTKGGIIQATYSVTLMHVSGATLPGFSRITIIHPIQGAQTVGSAMSYMDKVFMRQAFAVATGEAGADADETDPADLMGGVKKEEPKPSVTKADLDLPKATVAKADIELPGEEGNFKQVEDIFIAFLPTAATPDELNKFWTDNYKARDHLKEFAPDSFNRVLAAFTARKAQIMKEKK